MTKTVPISKDTLIELINRCDKFLTSKLTISEISVKAVKDLHTQISRLLDDADGLGVVSKSMLCFHGTWHSDPSISMKEERGESHIRLKMPSHANTRNGRHPKKPDNYKNIFESAVRHVKQNAALILGVQRDKVKTYKGQFDPASLQMDHAC